MSNLHKDLNDSQLHVPKGFAGASNSTACTKDSSGNLVWAATSGIGGDSLVFSTQGLRNCKTSAEYSHLYSTKLNNNWGLDNNQLPATLDAVDAMNNGRFVVPNDCTLTRIVARANCTSATPQCTLQIYHLRYDCSTQPTTITNTIIYKPIDRQTLIVDKLTCVDVISGFGISAMQAGDIIVVGSQVDGQTSVNFTYQMSMLFKI
tara:strand:- start:657 stop:1271 length:615 start_codon:yes stop_codon:yes gene_type:complete